MELIQDLGLDEALSDGVGRIDETSPRSVVVVAGDGVDQFTSDCLLEGQDTSGMRVDHAEHLVD